MSQQFVALDLETTGLSPEKDTIIEVAIIRFDIHADATGFHIVDVEEQSILVNPRKTLSEEVSMITGITDDMLQDQKYWEDIREYIAERIGDATIIGHNVLFDIAMLRSHGVRLDNNSSIDTFELSEIFSQESESLNLGYLANFYGISAGDKEHRALGDTRLSVGLLKQYLEETRTIGERKKSLLALGQEKEEYPSIAIFNRISGIDTILPFRWDKKTSGHGIIDASILSRGTSLESIMLTSLSPGRMEEKVFLKESIDSLGTGTIGVFGQQQGEYIRGILDELGISSAQIRTPGEFCSFVEIAERIEKPTWTRKETVLLVKLLFWLETTKAGLLSELKLYGEERSDIINFRMRAGEKNDYYEAYLKEREGKTIIIENLTRTLHEGSRGHVGGSIILKDIVLLEDTLRRSMSIHIDIERLVHTLEHMPGTRRLIGAVRWIEGIYLGMPDRPTGPDIIPPGIYGETYFFTQEDVWNHGKDHLSITNRVLIDAYHEWCQDRKIRNRHDEIHMEVIDRSIGAMITFHTVKEETGAVLEIKDDHVTLNYIPRTVTGAIHSFEQTYTHLIGYGVGIHGEKVSTFFQEELGMNTLIKAPTMSGHHNLILDADSVGNLTKKSSLGGTVILTTSARHVREIGQSLQSTGLTILMQGISGGRGKQLGIFTKDPTKTVLIGTIDMWREEMNLWKHAKHVIIAKLPFDPPTDPYFLARTVGMKNNFSLYSEPMVIIKMNTLIARIRSAGFEGPIFCEDMRLEETVWGKNLAKEIV